MVLPATRTIQLAETHSAHIDLLVFDFIMPGMAGLELVDALRADRPRAQHPDHLTVM